MTKQQAIETIKDLLRGRDHDPFWTDEMKEGYRHACRDITEALDAAGAFKGEPAGERYWRERAEEQQARANRLEFDARREPTITKAQARELWDLGYDAGYYPNGGPSRDFESAWAVVTRAK